MNRTEFLKLPPAVRRDVEKLSHFIRQCAQSGRSAEMDMWKAKQDGYLQALVALDVLSEAEATFIKGGKK